MQEKMSPREEILGCKQLHVYLGVQVTAPDKQVRDSLANSCYVRPNIPGAVGMETGARLRPFLQGLGLFGRTGTEDR